MSDAPILIVEDNVQILEANRRLLELKGYAVRTAASLEEARRAVLETPPGLMVLDIMLPDGSGLDFCRENRWLANTPILFLTALGEPADVVAGLRAGGDDYLSKPFSFEVFLARIEALLRRAQRNAQPTGQKLGPFGIDFIARRVYLGGRDVLLTPKEYELFRLLARNRAHYLPPEWLFANVWGSAPLGDVRTVYAHISKLRRKLEMPGEFDIVQKRGSGYRLVAPNSGPSTVNKEQRWGSSG